MAGIDEARRRNHGIALCGVLGALGVAVMLLGGVVPFATFCCPMLASLVLLPALDACGPAMSVGLYAVVGILSLLLAPDKEAAFLFVFLGCYPVLKPRLDRLRRRPLRMFCKLAAFNAAIALMYALLLGVIGMPELSAEYESGSRWLLAALVLLGNLAFLLYDLALVRLQALYRRRLEPQLRKLMKR